MVVENGYNFYFQKFISKTAGLNLSFNCGNGKLNNILISIDNFPFTKICQIEMDINDNFFCMHGFLLLLEIVVK